MILLMTGSRLALFLILLVMPLSAALAMARPPSSNSIERPAVQTAASLPAPAFQCAHDVESKLTSTRTLQANVLGFHTASLINPSKSEHFQGVARYMQDGKDYLFVSQSRKGRKSGVLATVEMGTRKGGLWGPNRERVLLGRERVFGSPPQGDRVIAVKTDEGFSQYNHPGGLAIVGDVLAIGMEGAHDETVHAKGRVDFYRIESPTSLRLFNSVANPDQYAASVAITRLSSGHYLLAVADNSPKNVRVFRTSSVGMLDENSEFEEVAVFSESDLDPGDNNYFQNLDFITDCASGRVYMVLAFQDRDLWGLSRKDRLARYEILEPEATPTLRRLGRQKFNCDPPFARNTCNFDAAFGVHVTPEGELIYYATESQDSGPNGSINFGELIP